MLTIALCIIFLLIGIFLMAWLVLRTIDKVFCTIGETLSTVLKGCFSKSPGPQVQYERTKKPIVDPGIMIKIMRFTFDFAINTIEEFYKKFDDFEADLWKEKDADNSDTNLKDFDSSGNDIFPSKESEPSKNTEGIPEEYLRNTQRNTLIIKVFL